MSRSRIHRVSGALLTVAMLFTAACSASSNSHDTDTADVGHFSSKNPGSVNTYWYGTPDGLILVDGLRTISDAKAALKKLDATGKPVVGIVLTHAHPDHVGGLGVFHKKFPKAPIYASAEAIKAMKTDPGHFYAVTRDQLGKDYPAKLTLPDKTVKPSAKVTIESTTFRTAQFGPDETSAMTVYYEPKTGTLFPGDLVDNRATPALLEGHTCGWLTDLDKLAKTFPDAKLAYPGHGKPGKPGKLIDAQRRYLTTFRGLVAGAIDADSAKGGKVTDDESKRIVAELKRKYPGYQPVASLPTIMELNIAAVAGEMRAEHADDLPQACRTKLKTRWPCPISRPSRANTDQPPAP